MATKPDVYDGAYFGPHVSPEYDFERFLPSLHGDRFYLQSSKEDFMDLLSNSRSVDKNTVEKSDPAELTEIAKRALGKGELEIAEIYFVKAIRTSILDCSSTKSPEPYFYLAEMLEKKAEDKELELLQKQRYLLQAAALYNFVRNYLESRDIDVELSNKLSKLVSRKLLDIQDNMITICGGNPLQSRFDAERKKNELKNLRNEVKESLESLKCQSSSTNQGRLNECEVRQKFKDQTAEVKKLSGTVSGKMKQFFASIIDECLAVLGTPSCDYEVIVFGSIARNETTPYSDFEWAILTSSEEEECKVFFRNLTNLVHLQVINLGETILPSMNIEAINGEWFYDDVTPRGVSFDGLLPQACKIPLGNMKDFELIHTPEKMAEFQSNEWYQKNWRLADTLMTFSPLHLEKSMLVKAYRNETDKILSSPCDSESCQHDASSDAWPTRGSCRGLRVLQEDLSRYWDMMTGNNDLDEGKFYDVKKEIYRLPDRLITALAKCCKVKSAGIFDILDELYEKEVISSEARDNLASASAIAIRLRLSTYLKVGKQDEQLSIISNEKPEENAPVYHMPTDEELFHFFFVAIPLYDELRQFKTFGNIPSSLASCSFFNNSGHTIGHIYCRLLKYDKAIECYERAVRENPDNLSAEIRRIRLALLASQNTQESEKVQESLDNLLGKLVKDFSQLDTDDEIPPPEFTPLINRIDMEEYQQLFAGLLFAFEIYNSLKYLRVALKIRDRFKIPLTVNEIESLPKDESALIVLLLAYMTTSNFYITHLAQEHEIDTSVDTLTLVIEKEGLSTKGIVLLNSLGRLLNNQGKLDKAYCCFQRSLSMQQLLYGNKPNEKTMTSLYFLGRIANKLKMYEESKLYFESLVLRYESPGGIKSKLIIKYTYLRLLCQSYTVEETLRFAEHGLKVTTGLKSEREFLLNCALYWAKAIKLHERRPEQAWEAVLNALACRKDCTYPQTREKMIFFVGYVLYRIKKSKEGIEVLEKELQTLTLESQVHEKFLCLKALGKLCLVQGRAPEAKKYYSQAIDTQEENDEHAFHDLECRIGILKAAVMEDSVAKEKPVLDKALLRSAMKLPADFVKCFFLKETGQFFQSKGEVGDARLCYLAALRSVAELPASDEKCSFLKETGKLFERISEVALAQQCYYEALKTYKKKSTICKKLPFLEVDLEMCLGKLAKKMIRTDSAQQAHYDRAAAILRQHVATGHVNSETVRMFLSLAEVYVTIDKNEAVQLLLERLKVSEIMYGEDKSHEMVTTSLQLLSLTYYLLGDMHNCMKCGERQIKMELEQYSSNPFLERIVTTLKRLALASFNVSSSKDSIERVSDFFLSSLNEKTFLLNTTAAKTVAAKCFTFIAVLFYTSGDFEKAKSLNEKASQLFGKVEERIETESDSCREICYLMKTILSSETTLPSHRTELYISFFNMGDPYPDIASAEEGRDGQAGNEEVIKEELKQKARSTLVEEQKTLAPLSIVHSQLEAFEHYKSKREFQITAEIHASLQQQQLSYYKNSPFDGEEKLVSEAIEAKNKSVPSKAIRLLDLALQLQLPKGQCRRTRKVLKLRGECFLSMGHFRSAAIDFTKADALYSTKTMDNHEDLCEYSEVLIGLIKSEILCNNVEAALLLCEKGTKLATDRELSQQAEKLLYLKVRCIIILLERGEKENKLDLANHLYEELLPLLYLTEADFKTIFEILFLLDDIFPSLPPKNENENRFEEIKRGKTMTISDYVSNTYTPADFMGDVSAVNLSKAEPEVLIKVAISCSLKARLLIYAGDLDQSINWLDRSLAAFCSVPRPDLLWYFEDFVPLLLVVTATKSNAPDQSRSPFQQAIDMCSRTLINQNKSSNYVNKFLTTSIIVYRSLGQAQEAMVVAEIGLEINDLIWHNSDSDKLNNRCRMLLHLAQIHEQNSSNPAFDADEELNLAEHYYRSDRGREEDMVLCKDLSYANFLCERKRFADAVTVLEDMRNLDQLLRNKYVYIEYFSCAFYGAGAEKSVKMDGELFTTVGDVLNNLLVRAYVGVGKGKEAIATCETLAHVNSPDVHEPVYGQRPSCKPYLVEDCHRELLSLLSEEDRHQFQNCDLPLSSPNLVKLYYMVGEYEMAVKYFPKNVESPEMLEMKISCLRLAGNELIDSNRGDKSISFFQQFLEMLQVKEGFLDKSFNNQCEILQTYSFANQYYIFYSLGMTHLEKENIDAAIQWFERCIELDENFTCDQDIVATLSQLYQAKAFTVDLDNEDSRKLYMDRAWELFQKLLQKTAELTTVVELFFALLLTRLGRNEEAVDHFYKVIERANDKLFVAFENLDKPLVDVYLRREIEAFGGCVVIQIKVLAAYELVLALMKLNQKGKAQNVALFLENLAKKYPLGMRHGKITHSMLGYAHTIVGNKEKATKIFISVLKVYPGHPPLAEALKSLGI